MTEKFDHISEETIKCQVDRFYMKIRKDPELKIVFEQMIGVEESSWQPHLQRMYAFWSAIMLNTNGYSGNPMQKHQDIPSFDINLFDRWLELFEETARELHIDEIAEHYIRRSQRIAENLKFRLYHRPSR